MSEKEKSAEQEPKKLYDNCNGCGEDYEIGPENSVVFEHSQQPECNFIYCACPHCDNRTRIFVNGHTIQRARELGIHIEPEEYASEQVENDWYEIRGLEKPRIHVLTDRQEKLVGLFALTLANCPEEDLYGYITDDNPNKPYPQRWA